MIHCGLLLRRDHELPDRRRVVRADRALCQPPGGHARAGHPVPRRTCRWTMRQYCRHGFAAPAFVKITAGPSTAGAGTRRRCPCSRSAPPGRPSRRCRPGVRSSSHMSTPAPDAERLPGCRRIFANAVAYWGELSASTTSADRRDVLSVRTSYGPNEHGRSHIRPASICAPSWVSRSSCPPSRCGTGRRARRRCPGVASGPPPSRHGSVPHPLDHLGWLSRSAGRPSPGP